MCETTPVMGDGSTSSTSALSVYRRHRRDTIHAGHRAKWCRSEAGRRLSNAILASQSQSADSKTIGAELLNAIEELTLDIDNDGDGEEAIPRDVMDDYLEIFAYLVRGAEVPEPSVRCRVHCVFDRLLSDFQPVAQNLLLSRLVELVAERTIAVEMEPQVLAWLVDHYRRRLAAKNENVRRVFRDEISHFYGLLVGLTYEDMVAAHPFFVAVLLLVREHATHRFGLPLLRAMRGRICERIEDQLADYLRMKELQARNRRHNVEKNVDEAEQNAAGQVRDLGPHLAEQSLFVLELIKFRLIDVTAVIKKALDL